MKYLAALLLLCTGCMTQGTERWRIDQAHQAFTRHPEWTEAERARILSRTIQRGMPRDQLILSWGWPISVENSMSGSTLERWVYVTTHVYVADGRVTGWQR